MLADSKQPPLNRSLALRTLRPDHPALAHPRLRKLAETGDASLRLDVVRLLGRQPDAQDEAVLLKLATASSESAELRAEAILGLANRATSAAVRQSLTKLLDDPAARSWRAGRSAKRARMRQRVGSYSPGGTAASSMAMSGRSWPGNWCWRWRRTPTRRSRSDCPAYGESPDIDR
ncbi:MAG: hypothetical protein U0736_06720 [Gemmataceae bacterium]